MSDLTNEQLSGPRAVNRENRSRKMSDQFWCSCGVMTNGSSGWTSHRAAHRRRDEWVTKFNALTRDQYLAAFPDRDANGVKKDRT